MIDPLVDNHILEDCVSLCRKDQIIETFNTSRWLTSQFDIRGMTGRPKPSITLSNSKCLGITQEVVSTSSHVVRLVEYGDPLEP